MHYSLAIQHENMQLVLDLLCVCVWGGGVRARLCVCKFNSTACDIINR